VAVRKREVEVVHLCIPWTRSIHEQGIVRHSRGGDGGYGSSTHTHTGLPT
jgi:hypothetical protein